MLDEWLWKFKKRGKFKPIRRFPLLKKSHKPDKKIPAPKVGRLLRKQAVGKKGFPKIVAGMAMKV